MNKRKLSPEKGLKTVKILYATRWGWQQSFLTNFEFSDLKVEELQDKNLQPYQLLTFALPSGESVKVSSAQTAIRPGDYPSAGMAVVKNEKLIDLISL